MEYGVRVHQDCFADHGAAVDPELHLVSGGSAGDTVFTQHYGFPHGGQGVSIPEGMP